MSRVIVYSVTGSTSTLRLGTAITLNYMLHFLPLSEMESYSNHYLSRFEIEILFNHSSQKKSVFQHAL
jgi:hypothetical protein